jgi:hypothetical protein
MKPNVAKTRGMAGAGIRVKKGVVLEYNWDCII